MWRRRGLPEEDSAVCANLVIRTLRDCGVRSGDFSGCVLIVAVNFSFRFGRCHFLFSCDTVWAVCFAGSAAVLLNGTFTFHPCNAMKLPLALVLIDSAYTMQSTTQTHLSPNLESTPPSLEIRDIVLCRSGMRLEAWREWDTTFTT